MANEQPSDNHVEEFLELKKKYEELQLRVTRFSVTEQELIYARNRLDREVAIYRRMQQFNSLALYDMADDEFVKLVAESLIDIFEVEIGFVYVRMGDPGADSLCHLEGYPTDDSTLRKLISQIESWSVSLEPNKVWFLHPATGDVYQKVIPFTNMVLTRVKDPALDITIYLLGGVTERGKVFYEAVGKDREAAFSVFAQQVLAHQTNRFKTQTIRQQYEALSVEQRRITSIAESFLDFDTNPDDNILKIVTLSAQLMSAACAIYEIKEDGPLIVSGNFRDTRAPHPNSLLKGLTRLPQPAQEDVFHIQTLESATWKEMPQWLDQFGGKTLLATRVFIDREPIGALALFLDPQIPVTDSNLQLIRILSAAIAVEERRKRALIALQESEEKYRVIFEGSPNGILVADMEQNKLLYANESIARMFGYTVHEFLRKTIPELHPREKHEQIRDGIRQTLSGVKMAGNEIPCLHQTGAIFYADIYSSSISLGGRNLITAFFSDVTQRKNDAQALVNSNIELKKINSELDNFVYSVSHDLRSPLLAIQGLIRLIMVSPEKLHPEVSNYLGMVMSSANRMDDTIKEILEYSRNARLEIKKSTIAFPQMIQEIFEDVKHIAPDSFKMHVKINGDTPFYSDPYRVNTLFKNIISNAVKYRRPDIGNAYLEIEVTVDAQQARITFSDNGEGIGPDHIDRIFEMFYRASNSSVGTGLGLYICREITHNLGGTIQVKSTPQMGSVFTVTLKNLN